VVEVPVEPTARMLPSGREVLRRLPLVITLLTVAFSIAWILFSAADTTYGSAVSDPIDFLKVVLDGLTYAGALFIVASGFTLIFGLMRTVNMAHGAYYVLGGLIAYDLQQNFTGGGGGFGLTSSQVGAWEWILPALIAAGCLAIVGLGTQQALLRWTQGQDLRQALITIALTVILLDQFEDHFNSGNAHSLTWPNFVGDDKFLVIGGFNYSWSRLFVLFVAIGIGILLWLWLQKTRTGMVIRAGVDDRHMVSALGVNVQITFAIAFMVGAGLAGFGGAVGGSLYGSLKTADAGAWLLNSLIVVIIGGMGSLGGAAAGAILLGLVSQLSGNYLPNPTLTCCYQYSPALTFALLVIVLALRPLGLFGRPG
jgi:branched-chain amino acid transport system permease protein